MMTDSTTAGTPVHAHCYTPIPCPHQSGDVADWTQLLPDFHPLLRDEVDELLTEALKHRCGIEIARLQVRLSQAVSGMTCPRPIRGEAFETDRDVQTMFLDGWRSGEFDREKIFDRLGV